MGGKAPESTQEQSLYGHASDARGIAPEEDTVRDKPKSNLVRKQGRPETRVLKINATPGTRNLSCGQAAQATDKNRVME